LEIRWAAARTSLPGPADWFQGEVRTEALWEAPEPARLRAVRVAFAPGARTAWHRHPLGQTLIVTEGRGWVCREGAPREEVGPGDVVWFPPGERHWHGATADSGLVHLAFQEAVEGVTVYWEEPVAEDDYRDGA
jgi:quercetin dioxygenase-like cupin family protein